VVGCEQQSVNEGLEKLKSRLKSIVQVLRYRCAVVSFGPPMTSPCLFFFSVTLTVGRQAVGPRYG
jgi:hypothetical protein